jgi:hypothetical protein
MTNIITLTTDFGRKDFYVAQLKGVILKLNKNAQVVDITHEIKRHDIFQGSFVLSQIWKYFPNGTVHLGIIDPGVGSKRKSLVIKTNHCVFIGPDNGLFSLALKDQKVEKIIEIDETKVKKISGIGKISNTFHGRDIFAPIAGLISKNSIPIKKFGKEVRGIKEIKEIKEIKIPKNEIIYIDNFGNIITSLEKRNFEINEKLVLRYNKKKKISARFVRTFSDAEKKGEFLLLEGSHGFLELDVREGNAAKKLDARVGDEIEILECD